MINLIFGQDDVYGITALRGIGKYQKAARFLALPS